jgi:hypothetical protein
MRKLILAIAALVVVAGAVAYAVLILPDQRFRSALDEQLRRLPAGVAAHYETAHYSLFSRQATVTGFEIRAEGDDGFDAKIAVLRAEQPALDAGEAWAKAAAGGTIQADGPLVLARSIEAKGLALDSGTSTFRLADFTIDEPKVDPAALLRPEVGYLLTWQKRLMAQNRPLTLDDFLPAWRGEAALIAGIAYDGYVMDDFLFSATMPALPNPVVAPGAPAAPAGPIDLLYRIGKIRAGRISHGMLDEALATDVSMQLGTLSSFTIERMEMSKLDFSPLLDRVLAGANLTPELLDGTSIGRIAYSGLHMKAAAGMDLPVGSSFSIGNIAFDHGLPVSGDLAYGGVHFSSAMLTANPQAVDAFRKLGLDAVTLSLRLAFKLDPQRRTLAVENTGIKIDELGTLDLSLAFADFVPSPHWAETTSLAHATLHFADASLVERLLQASASQNGVDLDTFGNRLVAGLRQQASAPDTPVALGIAARTFADFIGAPRTLTIELAPPSPVPVGLFAAASSMPPATLAERLGLTVAANP